MFSGSFISFARVLYMPPKLWPDNPTVEHYQWVLGMKNFWVWTSNTVIIAISTMVLSVIVSCMTGYVFSFHNIRFKKLLWILFLSGAIIPRISIIIPLFVVMGKIGITGNLFSVIIIGIFSPTGIYLARNYFDTIPKSLVESARIDGASEFQIIRKIIIPISKPLIATIGLSTVIGALGDFMWQSLQLQNDTSQTLLVALMREVLKFSVDQVGKIGISHSLTIGMFMFFPLLIVFIFANKHFVGTLSGAVKE
jgi:ABC-type glycerol-3-phosphate transport system permease component